MKRDRDDFKGIAFTWGQVLKGMHKLGYCLGSTYWYS